MQSNHKQINNSAVCSVCKKPGKLELQTRTSKKGQKTYKYYSHQKDGKQIRCYAGIAKVQGLDMWGMSV